MKKIILSCLTLLLALSFSNFAGAQAYNIDYPLKNDGSSFSPQAPKGTKTLYICLPTRRPIDLSYDVLGRYLDVNKGAWQATWNSLGISSAQLISTGRYDGRNVFKLIDATPGVYVFDFVAFDGEEFCDVDSDDYFRAIVYLIEPPTAAGYVADYGYCVPLAGQEGALRTQQAGDFGYAAAVKDLLPAAFKQMMENMSVTIASVPSSGATLPSGGNPWPTTDAGFKVTAGTHIYYADITLTGNDYPCDNSFTVSAKATITEEKANLVIDVPKKVMCVSDAITLAETTAHGLFGRIDLGSASGYTFTDVVNEVTYTSADDKIKFLAGLTSASLPKEYEFTYSYDSCNGNIATKKDIIRIVADDSPELDLPFAKLEACATSIEDQLDLRIAYDRGVAVPSTAPKGVMYPANEVHWFYVGVKKDGSGNPLYDAAGVRPYADATGSEVAKLLGKKLRANMPYYFKFQVDATAGCLAGISDTLMVVADNGVSAGDGRLQVCRELTAPFSSYNFTTLMALKDSETSWNYAATPSADYPVLTAGTASGNLNTATLNASSVGTYKYNYAGVGACVSGGGIFYLTVKDAVVYSKTIEETFCRESLPAGANLNYIMGVWTSGVWTTSVSSTYFKADGSFDIIQYVIDNPTVNSITFKFTPDANSCIPTTDEINVTINFVDTL